MIKKIRAGLKYITDFYITAPVGETIFLMNAGQIPFDYRNPLLMSINIIGTLAGAALTIRQFKLRHRLESSVSKHGYNDKIFEPTIPLWCDRQTARVVTKNCGNLNDYVALCNVKKIEHQLNPN